MLYEKLNLEMKNTVDAYVGRLRPLAWGRRSDLLAEAALPFGDDLPPDKAKVAARGFLTAVLERLGDGEVTHPVQAHLFQASLNPEHQALAERWFEKNPGAGDGGGV